MDEETIKEYMKKIELINNMISDEDNDDDLADDIFESMESVLGNLSEDIVNTMKKGKTDSFGASGWTQSNILEVKVKKLREDAVIPTYAKAGDAGMDLTITHIISETEQNINYGYGIAFEIPNGYVGLLFPRSSIRKYDLVLSNCVGVIDSGYRGEIQTTFKKTPYSYGDNDKYLVGDRGAQIVIMPYPQVKMVESNELSNSERGEGGFGSTDKK